MRLGIIVIVASLLGGCAAGIQSQRYAVDSRELNDTNSGVVVGAQNSSSGFSVLNLRTGDEVEYLMSSLFCFRLPAGEYSLYSIGERTAPLGSDTPFTFTVAPGDRKYIGTIVKPWHPPMNFRVDRSTVISVRPYRYDMRLFASGGGPHNLYGPTHDLIVVSQFEEIRGKIKAVCPSVDPSSIRVDPMR
jgi:hypothetical protein